MHVAKPGCAIENCKASFEQQATQTQIRLLLLQKELEATIGTWPGCLVYV